MRLEVETGVRRDGGGGGNLIKYNDDIKKGANYFEIGRIFYVFRNFIFIFFLSQKLYAL